MSNMALITEYDPPTNVALYHLSTFADIGNRSIEGFVVKGTIFHLDADGELEHLLPVCMNADCSDSRIYVRDNNEVSEGKLRRTVTLTFLVVPTTDQFRSRGSVPLERCIPHGTEAHADEYQSRRLQSRRLSRYCGCDETQVRTIERSARL